MLFVPTLLAFVGLTLSALVVVVVLRAAMLAMSPSTWQEKWVHASFITFAWHEFGRALFLGAIVAVGTAPLSVAFFAGSQAAVSNVAFLTMLSWAAFSAAIFVVGITTGLVGFLRYEAGSPSQHSIITLAQLTIVAIGAVPVLIIFLYYLVPSLSMVVGLWFETMGLYAQLAS